MEKNTSFTTCICAYVQYSFSFFQITFFFDLNFRTKIPLRFNRNKFYKFFFYLVSIKCIHIVYDSVTFRLLKFVYNKVRARQKREKKKKQNPVSMWFV